MYLQINDSFFKIIFGQVWKVCCSCKGGGFSFQKKQWEKSLSFTASKISSFIEVRVLSFNLHMSNVFL